VGNGIDNVGHLTQVSSGSTNYVTIPAPPTGYDSSNNVLTYDYGNGVAATATYSQSRGQLSTLSYTNGGTTLFGLNYYQYDGTNCKSGTTTDDGLIQCIADSVQPGRSVSYAYDQLNRLTQATSTGSTTYPQWGLSWAYDRYGNRLSQSISAGCTLITCPTNSLTFSSSGGALTNRPDGYSFDAAGNLLNDGMNAMGYDGNNHLTATVGSLGSGSYTYDGDAMRIERSITGTSTVSIFAEVVPPLVET
jgi:hypothetical protein